jgi:ABC-type Fe3+-hydroxamate transport system substrate-binding protein
LAALRITDDYGRLLVFGSAPRRVVSLVPSETLTLFDLGCGGALVGRTDYCELPADGVKSLPSVGGTKNPRIDDILALSPDLVIANQEENTKGDLEKLAQAGARVFISFPRRVAEGLSHVARLAQIFGVAGDPRVRDLVKRGYEAVREAEAALAESTRISVFCPIWMKPLMTIHGDTFMSDMISLCGGRNVFADRERKYPLAADLGKLAPLGASGRDTRYPRVTLEEVTARAPELVLLPNEPHPFTEEDAAVFRALHIPAAARNAIVMTDGKDLSWYGTRSIEGIPRVRQLLRAYSCE